MSYNNNEGIKIFIGVQENFNFVTVSVTLLNDPENIHPDWFISNLNYTEKTFSSDQKTAYLTYNKKEYRSLGLTYSGKLYDFINEDLFEYLQTEKSAYGRVIRQESDTLLYVGVSFGLIIVASAILFGISSQYKTKTKTKK